MDWKRMASFLDGKADATDSRRPAGGMLQGGQDFNPQQMFNRCISGREKARTPRSSVQELVPFLKQCNRKSSAADWHEVRAKCFEAARVTGKKCFLLLPR